MTAENIIKMLGHGEEISTDEVTTLAFAGHTWHVKTFIGSYPRAIMLLEGDRSVIDKADIVTAFVRAACVVMASGGGKRKTVRRLLAELVDAEYALVAENLDRLKTERRPN